MAPLTNWAEIKRLINTTVERADLDFKEKLPDPKDFELAKDIAALANGLGGSIVIGAATTEKFLCTGLPGISLQDAIFLTGKFEEAASHRCRPRAVLDCAVICLPSDPSKAVLCVNVAAAPSAPIGVDQRHKGDDQAWKFPLRTTSQTIWLSPDQFGVLEQMTARRAGALLASIPFNERKQIMLNEERSLRRPRSQSTSGGSPRWRGPLYGSLEDVDYRGNVAHFMMGEKEGDGRFDFRVPLDWVSTAWKDRRENRWVVLVDCAYSREPRASHWIVARLEE